MRQSIGLFSLLLALLCAAIPRPAQAGAVPGELPTFVGSLSTVQGDVRWYDRDSAAWLGTPQQPLRNWPLAAGDRLRTGADGRAELRLGSTTVRLGADVDLTLQRLDEQGLVLFLQSGTLALRLADGPAGDNFSTELLTPEGRWLPRQPGHYRFDRPADGRRPWAGPATQATTWRGALRFEGSDSAIDIPAGRRADLWLDPASGISRYAWAALDRDRFADWVARDERLDDAPLSARRVPAGITGWQALDRHGDWINDPDYGDVWRPRVVDVGWAPFQQGRWAWVAPWGWTWIDAAPWGFAPFHYGSWVVWQDRWCWSPGPRQDRPRYAPALSAWIAPAPAPAPGLVIRIDNRPPPPLVIVPVLIVLQGNGGHDRRDWQNRPGPPERRDGRDEAHHDRRDDRRDERRDERRDDHRNDRRDSRPAVAVVLPPTVLSPALADRPDKSDRPTRPGRPMVAVTPAINPAMTPAVNPATAPAPAAAVQPVVPPKPVAPPAARPAALPPVLLIATMPAAATAPAPRAVKDAEPRREAREPRAPAENAEDRRPQEPQRRERQDRPERGISR